MTPVLPLGSEVIEISKYDQGLCLDVPVTLAIPTHFLYKLMVHEIITINW